MTVPELKYINKQGVAQSRQTPGHSGYMGSGIMLVRSIPVAACASHELVLGSIGSVGLGV